MLVYDLTFLNELREIKGGDGRVLTFTSYIVEDLLEGAIVLLNQLLYILSICLFLD